MPIGCHLGGLVRARRASISIEFATSAFILMLFVIGLARASAILMDMAADDRALAAGLDIAAVLDLEGNPPARDDLDRLASVMADLGHVAPGEAYAVRIGVFKYDHLAARLVTAWDYAGGQAGLLPNFGQEGQHVQIQGDPFFVEDDERLIVVEWARAGRGFDEGGAELRYRKLGLAFLYDPDHL